MCPQGGGGVSFNGLHRLDISREKLFFLIGFAKPENGSASMYRRVGGELHRLCISRKNCSFLIEFAKPKNGFASEYRMGRGVTYSLTPHRLASSEVTLLFYFGGVFLLVFFFALAYV